MPGPRGSPARKLCEMCDHYYGRRDYSGHGDASDGKRDDSGRGDHYSGKRDDSGRGDYYRTTEG